MNKNFLGLATIILLILSEVQLLSAKDPYPLNRNLDILHYRFHLTLSDSTDAVSGKSEITLRLEGNSRTFELDLVGPRTDGTGMTVTEAGPADLVASYQQINGDRIRITLREGAPGITTLVIRYKGVPADGLIIGRNKFGNRGFFGDNWPDRGHHWLPTVDHPADKASVEFLVDAPEHYTVVATGKLKEESALPRQRKFTHWSEEAPVPVKVMTIGAARFAVRHHGAVEGTEVSTWVYPQDRDAGFRDFACADSIFQFFSRYIGPYSFEKLAHVQSRTRWGGLENAGAIFYAEKAVTGNRKIESLVAHETAHQWFGDSATEDDWHHVWLSEGFATYFAHLYHEYAHGADSRRKNMDRDRTNILRHELLAKSPVVDTTILDINKVLSIITYQKASWVLHMLRTEVGDAAFQLGIRAYYDRFKEDNALTSDLISEMERAAGRDLKWFFRQWVFSPGAPDLTVRWEYSSKTKELKLRVIQNTPSPFRFSLDFSALSGSIILAEPNMLISGPVSEIKVKCTQKPTQILLDPKVNLLFGAKITEGRL